MLQVVFLISIVSGCSGHTQNKSSGTGSFPESSSGTISGKIDSHSSIPVDMEKIKKDQRAYLENEKTLREDTTIAAKVNNTTIYQSQIEIKLIENNAILESYRTQLDAMNLPEQDKTKYLEAYTTTLSLNKKDIMNGLIREAVIQLEAGKRGLIPTAEDVMTKAQKQFANIKNTPGMYESAQLHMEVMNLSEEAYFRLIIDEHKKATGQANLYQQITSRFETDEDKRKAFNAAVDEWIAQAEIVIINKQE